MKREGYVKMILWKAANTQAEGLIKYNQIHGPLIHLKTNNTHCIDISRDIKIPIGLLIRVRHGPTHLHILNLDFHGTLKFSLIPKNVTNNMYGLIR